VFRWTITTEASVLEVGERELMLGIFQKQLVRQVALIEFRIRKFVIKLGDVDVCSSFYVQVAAQVELVLGGRFLV
jgi:hypothetical protein